MGSPGASGCFVVFVFLVPSLRLALICGFAERAGVVLWHVMYAYTLSTCGSSEELPGIRSPCGGGPVAGMIINIVSTRVSWHLPVLLFFVGIRN